MDLFAFLTPMIQSCYLKFDTSQNFFVKKTHIFSYKL